MEDRSPFLLVKQLEADVVRLLSYVDVSELEIKDQQTVSQLKNVLIDARLEIQDYELAETRDDQLKNASLAKQYLGSAEKLITSNPAGIFGAVDVAHLTARISQIRDKLI